MTVIVLEATVFWSAFLSVHSPEVFQDRHQHQAGWPGVLHVSAEVPAASLFHADDPPVSLPCWWPHWWGEGAEICICLFLLIHILVPVFESHFFFALWIVRERWTSTSGPSPSPGCCSSLWRSSAGKALSSWMLEQYDAFSTVIIYNGGCLCLWLTHALFSFLKGDLFVDWAELQSYLPHTSSGSSQLCCCAWQPGKKACAATVILRIKHFLNLLSLFFPAMFA